MIHYLVRVEHHHITEEFGTCSESDPYDHYIGDIHERSNLRYIILNDKEFSELLEACIPDDPYDYDSVDVIYTFNYDWDLKRFLGCMTKEINLERKQNGT